MKYLLLIFITLSTVTFASTTQSENQRLCKVFSQKAINYKKHMRHDTYALKTLDSYEARAKIYCSK